MPKRVRDLPPEMKALHRRVAEALDETGNATRRVGPLTQSTVSRLRNDPEYDPGISMILEVSRHTGYRAEWLLTGRLPKRYSDLATLVRDDGSAATLEDIASALRAYAALDGARAPVELSTGPRSVGALPEATAGKPGRKKSI